MLRSRIVRGLRLILPLGALGLLSVLFLLGRSPEPDAAIPYATDTSAADLERGAGMTGADYAGVTRDGTRLRLAADHAVPSGSDGAATGLRLSWDSPGGLTAELTAPDAQIAEGRVHLTGGVRLTTSTGWSLSAPEAVAETAADRLDATGGVAAEAPFGRVTADALRLTRSPQGTHVLDLNGRVRLVYHP